jgi:tRNA-uridine 2-sulfurtransferase
MKTRVCMALSGGVDSAVSAALLLEQGYDVHAVFIKVWQPDFLDCTQEEDRKSAKRVAAALGIPFEVLDAADAYKQKVIDVMVRGYSMGTTPNPDILCNQYIKFGILADHATAIGATHIATGHYAQVITYNGTQCLQKAHDASKDQVYFLAQVAPSIISRCIFPIGNLLKSKTRKLAEERKLPVFDKKDSQGLCFMGMVDMAEFLSHTVQLTEGAVLNIEGKHIGTHGGAQQFTLGQRHGFTLNTATHDPHYVTAVDVSKNTITVSDMQPEGRTDLSLTSVVSFAETTPARHYSAQVRYHGSLTLCSIVATKDSSVRISLEEPVSVAAGQTVVIYDGDVLVLSGIATV